MESLQKIYFDSDSSIYDMYLPNTSAINRMLDKINFSGE